MESDCHESVHFNAQAEVEIHCLHTNTTTTRGFSGDEHQGERDRYDQIQRQAGEPTTYGEAVALRLAQII